MIGVFIFIAILICLIFISGIKIVPQAQVYVVERLGTFKSAITTGPHFICPLIDKVVKKVTIKEQVVDFKPQAVITKDNVSMQIDTVVFITISDAKLYTYGVERPMQALENLTATTLRNIIGEMELDSTLTSRDTINSKITAILDEATDRWGIKVNRVEVRNIIPPREIQDAMEKQMKAERERREKILQAEGEKKSAILIAEGEKQAQILRAEADKESAILQAQAEQQSMLLKAEAIKKQKILEAEGEAEAIQKIQEANAAAIIQLNNANPNQGVIAIKSLETLEKVADGKSTKLIIPSEIQSLAGLTASLKDISSSSSPSSGGSYYSPISK